MVSKNLFEMLEVTPYTLAVIPYRTRGGKLYSKILEKNAEFIVKLSPTELMEKSCNYFGSSLEGKQEGTKKILKYSHKLPICLEALSNMYFFPSTSPSNENCHWLAHSHIRELRPTDNFKTEVVFFNGKSIIVDVSHGSLENQLHRTAQYKHLLNKRIKSMLSYADQHYYPRRTFHRDLTDFYFVAEHYLDDQS